MKNQRNATSVTMHHVGQVTWGYIWKHTMGRNSTNATNVTIQLFGKAIWKSIQKYTLEKIKRKLSQCNCASPQTIDRGIQEAYKKQCGGGYVKNSVRAIKDINIYDYND